MEKGEKIKMSSVPLPLSWSFAMFILEVFNAVSTLSQMDNMLCLNQWKSIYFQ